MDGFGLELVADGLLIATALAAAIYCAVLSRRLRRLASTDEGIGGQITALNAAVEETRVALTTAQEKIEALRNQSGQSSERVRREMAQARKLSEELAEAATEARALLDKLYTAEAPVRARSAAPLPPDGNLPDVAEPMPDDAGEPFAVIGGDEAPPPAAGEPVAARDVRAQAPEETLDAAFEEVDVANYSFGAEPDAHGFPEQGGEDQAAPDSVPQIAVGAAELDDDDEPAAPADESRMPVAAPAAAAGGRALRLQRMAF
ncbi:MAG: hypothetical protein AAFP17_16880 [Pseudomonadota bacterium]